MATHPNPNSQIGARRLTPGLRHQPRHIKEDNQPKLKMVSGRLPEEDVERLEAALTKINSDRKRISKQDFIALAINRLVDECEAKLEANEPLDL